MPKGYDHKYIYSHIGYNLKATDMQAALGLSQLTKIDQFVNARKLNFDYLYSQLSKIEGLMMPVATLNSEPSWFGFPITLNPQHPVNRTDFLKHLDSKKIGTRLMFAGNITKQPAYSHTDFKVVGALDNTNIAMERSFWIGVHPGLNKDMLNFMIETISEYMEGHN